MGVSQVLRLRMSLVQVVVVVLGVVIKDVRSQDYGPVNLDTVDPLSLSWNQIHWLVKDQIKEVEDLKAEHDEVYNEITGCYGLEKCLAEFDLLDIKPGSKLWSLGLRKVDLSMSALTKQREVLVQKEEQKMKNLEQQRLELQRQTELEKHRLEAAKAQLESSSGQSSFGSSSGSSSSSSWSTSSSSYSRNSGGGFAQGRPSIGQTPWGGQGQSFFSNSSTVYGQKPQVYERRYEYSSKQKYGTF